MNYRNTDGPFVLRFNTSDRYCVQFNGQYVRNTFRGGPGTNQLSDAKVFYTVGSAKASSYGASCELVPVVISPRKSYLVWSNEHSAWWAPDQRGYTRDIKSAGRYPRDEAMRIAQGFGWAGGNPDEIAIPEEDALEQSGSV